jgi:hypothetical protein
MNGEDVARLFHETYERLAPLHGYETRKASAVPWDDVPEPNRSLMIAVAAEVAPVIAAQAAAAERERLRRAVNSDGFQATIRAYVLEGSAADDVSDAVLDLLGGES